MPAASDRGSGLGELGFDAFEYPVGLLASQKLAEVLDEWVGRPADLANADHIVAHSVGPGVAIRQAERPGLGITIPTQDWISA
jgi:hypothetical protein